MLDRDGVSDDIHLFNEKLRKWEDYYNYHRPRRDLGGQTPFERAGVPPGQWDPTVAHVTGIDLVKVVARDGIEPSTPGFSVSSKACVASLSLPRATLGDLANASRAMLDADK